MTNTLHSPYPECKCDPCKVKKNLVWLRQEMDDIYHRIIWEKRGAVTASKLEDWMGRIKTMENTLGSAQ